MVTSRIIFFFFCSLAFTSSASAKNDCAEIVVAESAKNDSVHQDTLLKIEEILNSDLELGPELVKVKYLIPALKEDPILSQRLSSKDFDDLSEKLMDIKCAAYSAEDIIKNFLAELAQI